jgi:hypothetical protein
MESAYRQGEILFIKVENMPKWAREHIHTKYTAVENNVIREGETTGHKHEVVGTKLMTLDKGRFFYKDSSQENDPEYPKVNSMSLPDGEMFLTSEGNVEIKHPEHKTLKLEKGDYVVRIQREYDESQKFRNVAD